jgi:undecaprenyl pyrophosphate phosphatase UppP
MRRLYTGNAHRLGFVLAVPMLAIAFLLLIFQDHNKLLFVLSFLALAALIYGGVVLLQFVDKALVERRQGKR